jgi:hypothetical protein
LVISSIVAGPGGSWSVPTPATIAPPTARASVALRRISSRVDR